MPRRSILSAAERESLLALPDSKDDLIRHYTFNDTDLSIIRQRRGPANRLGFAVQLCYLRFPGVILGVDELPFPPLLKLVAAQLKVGVESWNEYGQREQTRREHLSELQTVFGFRPFTMSHYRQAVQMLTELAMQTDKGIVLASALIGHLRRQSVILPALNAVERASAEAITRANRRIYAALAEPLADAHRRRRDDLLTRARPDLEGDGGTAPEELGQIQREILRDRRVADAATRLDHVTVGVRLPRASQIRGQLARSARERLRAAHENRALGGLARTSRALADGSVSLHGLVHLIHDHFLPVGTSEVRAAMNASCGTSTRPIDFIRFLPSFCFSSSLRLRVISPP